MGRVSESSPPSWNYLMDMDGVLVRESSAKPG